MSAFRKGDYCVCARARYVKNIDNCAAAQMFIIRDAFVLGVFTWPSYIATGKKGYWYNAERLTLVMGIVNVTIYGLLMSGQQQTDCTLHTKTH